MVDNTSRNNNQKIAGKHGTGDIYQTNPCPSFDDDRNAKPAIENSQADADLLSVIIPCFNQAHFLGEAVESILAQSYRYFEIIVVDDGSGDNTADITDRYPGVRYIRQENQGLSSARNTGLHKSRGNYIVFLDADDRLLPHALETGLTCLRNHPECAYVSGHYRYIKTDGSFLYEYPQVRIEKDYYMALLMGNYIGMHATVMYRRSFLELVGGFNTCLKSCEDYDLYLRIARRFPVFQHNVLVAEYRRHNNNMSGNPELMLKTVLFVLRSQWEYAKEDKLYKKAYKAGIRSWKEYYGTELITQILRMRKFGEIRQVLRGTMILLRYTPQFLVKCVCKQIAHFSYKILKPLTPAALCNLLVQRWKIKCLPPVGEVNLGDLRRLTPFTQDFNQCQGMSIDRYYIENFLSRYTDDIRGRILEIGSDEYVRKFGRMSVTNSEVLHLSGDVSKVTSTDNLASAGNIPTNTYDCVICIQTLQYVYNLSATVQTIYRILKTGGVLLVTVPGIGRKRDDILIEDGYWNFTTLSVRRLFEENFGSENVIVEFHGNVLIATAFLNGLNISEFHQKERDYCDPRYQLLITLRAQKT